MQLNLKPSHAKVREYYSVLHQFGQLNISHETAVRQAFAGRVRIPMSVSGCYVKVKTCL